MRKKKWQRFRRTLLRYIDKGYSYARLGRMYGVSRQRIYEICKQLGIEKANARNEIQMRLPQIKLLYQLGLTLDEVAAIIGAASPALVRQILLDESVKLRNRGRRKREARERATSIFQRMSNQRK